MTDKRNNETLAQYNARKAREMVAATEQHLANANAWATLAVYGPEEYKDARLKMVAYELQQAGKL